VSDTLLGRSKASPLPTNISPSVMPQQFCDFFADKIKRIRDDLDHRPSEPPTVFYISVNIDLFFNICLFMYYPYKYSL
jgi:hypothetical protein